MDVKFNFQNLLCKCEIKQSRPTISAAPRLGFSITTMGRIWTYPTFGYSSRDLLKQISSPREQPKDNKRLLNTSRLQIR